MALDPQQIKAAALDARQKFEQGIAAMGGDCAFTLRGTGEKFSVKGVIKHQPEAELTGGINQDRRRLSVSDIDWSAAAPAGREPQKGDQVVIDGHRHAIMEADPVLMSGIRILWRIRLRG